uniref:cytochrome P450 n=1 Tax=Nocardia suismassiliense TaxID=2077092 RepID=UPI003F490BA4
MTTKVSRDFPLRTFPGPPLSATPRLLRTLIKDRLALMGEAAEYGDQVKVSLGPKTLYIFNHPDHAKHVLADNASNYHKGIGLVQARRALGDGLLTSEGTLWRQQRKVIQPVFQVKRLAAQAGAICEEAEKLTDRFRARIGAGPINASEEMTSFTLGVLGKTLLDADLGGFESIGHSFEAVQDQAMFEMTSLGLVPAALPLPKQRRFRRARRELDRIVEQLIDYRKANPTDGDDVLTRLIESTREETTTRAAQRCRDELVTLLLAGHETTASVLGWTFHLLDLHPDVAQRVREESREVLGDRRPVYADLTRLRYTTKVIEEVMRLYPPVWILPRTAQSADRIGDYEVPAGADVLVCPYTLHRHPQFWDNPERFDPERFDQSTRTGRHRYAYIPFGAGPRVCVGSHLGMMEAIFVIAMVTRDLHLKHLPAAAPVVAEPMLSLRIRGGLPMTVQSAT